MAVLLEDIVKSLLKLIGKETQQQSYVDPTLDPVLFVPGIAGSILNAVDEKTGKKERVWVRILGADHEFCDKLWSHFDPVTGKTLSLDADTHIEVPQDRHGLYAIDTLDPDMVIGSDSVYYFHDMIVEFLKWVYQEGTTLFGFGYDFRQSNRFQGTLERLASKLESVYSASGGKKMNIISHSMGGLLIKCFMNLHSDIFENYGSEDAPISDLQQLPTLAAKFIYVDGDGTVPTESSKADGVGAEARVGVPGNHRGILCDSHVFRILKHWLKADHDRFYNPVNDYVILPTAFELETLRMEGLQITSVAEEWEVIGEDEDCKEDMAEVKPSGNSISVSCNTGDEIPLQEEVLATVIIVQPQNDG